MVTVDLHNYSILQYVEQPLALLLSPVVPSIVRIVYVYLTWHALVNEHDVNKK